MTVTILRNRGSRSARHIAEGLRAQGVRVGLACVDDTRRCRGSRYVINWGVTQTPRNFRQRTLTLSNAIEGVIKVRDKLLTFPELNRANVPTLEWTTQQAQAEAWLATDEKVFVRATTTGQAGAGITVVSTGQGVPRAPLYTRRFRKDTEYRVHVAFGEAIHIQQKRRRNGWEGDQQEAMVRNHENGYVFTTQNLDCDRLAYRELLTRLAVSACAAVGVSHAAVDILARHKRAGASLVVCELNSCPAADANSTREAYVRAFAAAIHTAGYG